MPGTSLCYTLWTREPAQVAGSLVFVRVDYSDARCIRNKYSAQAESHANALVPGQGCSKIDAYVLLTSASPIATFVWHACGRKPWLV